MKTQFKLITGPEYAAGFKDFLDRSYALGPMEDFLYDTLNHYLQENPKEEINLLSIGAGTGVIERETLDRFKTTKINYYGLEPNKKHMQELKQTFEGYQNKTNFLDSFWTENFTINVRFDLIMFSHSLYYMEEPVNKILHAIKFLKETGLLVVFHQSQKGITELNKGLSEIFTLDRYARHDIGTSDLKADLDQLTKKKRLSVEVVELPSYTDFTGLFEPANSDILNNILSFFVLTNVNKLPPPIYDHVLNKTKHIVVDDKFDNPSGALIISKIRSISA